MAGQISRTDRATTPITRPARSFAAALLLVGLLGSLLLGACGSTVAPPAKVADPAADALARGIAAHQANRIEDAQKAYFETLSFDPKNKFAFYNLGQIARTADKLAIAEGYYRSALEIDPAYGPALFALGAVRQAFDATAEAIALYRRAIAAEPTNAAAHYNLGILLRLTGKTAEGDAEIARAIQLDPKLPAPPAVKPTPSPSPTPKR